LEQPLSVTLIPLIVSIFYFIAMPFIVFYCWKEQKKINEVKRNY